MQTVLLDDRDVHGPGILETRLFPHTEALFPLADHDEHAHVTLMIGGGHQQRWIEKTH